MASAARNLLREAWREASSLGTFAFPECTKLYQTASIPASFSEHWVRATVPALPLGVVRPRPVFMCTVDYFVSNAVQPCRHRAVHCRTSQGSLGIVPPGLEGWAGTYFRTVCRAKICSRHDGFDSRPPWGVGQAHGSSSRILDTACSHPPMINRPPVGNVQTTVAGNSHFLCGAMGHRDAAKPEAGVKKRLQV